MKCLLCSEKISVENEDICEGCKFEIWTLDEMEKIHRIEEEKNRERSEFSNKDKH